MDVNLAFYKKKDWKKFLSMIDDRDSMFDTWDEWHKSQDKSAGYRLMPVSECSTCKAIASNLL